ncbi:hypothetical protein ACFVR1_17560 [Psychrobacillus sp. NPDC058041]|uniref:hypothetical protein n=1 Tax=Psychrobacillus sp. NPDC058041 TaxID=3346310 RepID=UPI0036D8198C
MAATEWYRIFSLTIPSTWIAFILATVLTGIVIYFKFNKETSSQFGDFVFMFILVWKFSIVLTDFSSIIKHPWMILYFSGGRTGVYIGVMGVILNLFYRQIQHKSLPSNGALALAFISFYSSFAVLIVLLNRSSILDTVLVLIVAILMALLMLNYRGTIHLVLPFLLVYCILHLILRETIFSTTMITAFLFGAALFLFGKGFGVTDE